MGPTNIALVKLFRADQALREAIERLDSASRNVRVQDRRVNDLAEKLKLAQNTLREAQSRAKQLELDIGTRDAHIEKLRTQQQVAKNNKEYQAFLVEINTQKVDKGKVEEEQLKAEEAVETAQTETSALQTQLETERQKLADLKQEIGHIIAEREAEVESLRPAREQAGAAVPTRIRESFDRLAEHHDGEAMSAISKPDRRREEYLCTACNMELARDVYNKLHSRDEVVFCPSCRRILYIPDDLPPEEAIGTGRPVPKAAKTPGPRKVRVSKKKAAPTDAAAATETTVAADGSVIIEPRAKGILGEALAKAQGETVGSAVAAGENPVECEVYYEGELAGIYKGQTPDKLERAIKWFLSEAKLEGRIEVKPLQLEEPAPAPEAAAEPTASEPASIEGSSNPESVAPMSDIAPASEIAPSTEAAESTVNG